MDDDSFTRTIEFWRSQYPDRPEELIAFLVQFAHSLNDTANEYHQEIETIRKDDALLEKKVDDLLHVVTALNNALNNLYDAHAVSPWLRMPCHCEAHQKAQEVLMDVALWGGLNKSSQTL